MTRKLGKALIASAAVGALALGSTAASGVPFGFSQDRSAELAAQIDSSKPKSVILLIGDGTDDSIITAARNYELGAAGRFALDELPFTGAMTTYGLKVGDGPDYPIAYVSDSAPTASGWSTGKKTVDSRVSQGPSTALDVPGEDYETVLEKFAAAGKLTGNVSTAELTDATPAAAASHINNRSCQGPENMGNCTETKKSNGGKGSIAEQLVDNEVDVLLGGGANRFNQATDAGPTVLEYATGTKGYNVVSNKTELASVTSLDDGPVLGLFASGNMTPRYSPLTAKPGGSGSADYRCELADRGQQPTLAEMTSKAIELLDNDKGFFLQVESAMVDKQEHASDICGAVGDVLELDKAVQVALDYQADHPDTLIIVTGDHAHSTQIVGGVSGGKQTATLKTADGDPMHVAYSTQDTGSAHTGAQIRVAASGPQAANVTGTIDQTDLFATMLGRTPSKVKGNDTITVYPKPSVTVRTSSKIRKSTIKKTGLKVSVAAAGSRSTTVKVTRGSKTLASKKVSRNGGTATIKVKNAKPGTIKVTVTATGKGGTRTVTKSVRVVK